MAREGVKKWWAIFPDYRDLSRGIIQDQPWGGGSNMTSDFEVVSYHHLAHIDQTLDQLLKEKLITQYVYKRLKGE